MVNVFFAYSHKDEALRDELEVHLAMLKRQGVIGTWHDRRIGVGVEIDEAISKGFVDSQIILLLISSDFLASRYCYEIEMTRAMERHRAGTARVIPVILRPCDWHEAPFGALKAVPKDGRPITKYPDRDDALLEVAQAVREAAAKLSADQQEQSPAREAKEKNPVTAQRKKVETSPRRELPRSSNLRISKTFSDRERDSFLRDGFEYIANCFEGSLEELKARNSEIATDFVRIDALRFTAAIYRGGDAIARCSVWRDDNRFGGDIKFSLGQGVTESSYNESLSVEADSQSLYLKPLGMSSTSGAKRLTYEGAAEFLWALLIEPLQREY